MEPIPEGDGNIITQRSMLIEETKKITGLYTKENVQYKVMLEAVKNIQQKIGEYLKEKWENKPKLREILLSNTLPVYLIVIEEEVKKNWESLDAGKSIWVTQFLYLILKLISVSLQINLWRLVSGYPNLLILMKSAERVYSIYSFIRRAPKSRL